MTPPLTERTHQATRKAAKWRLRGTFIVLLLAIALNALSLASLRETTLEFSSGTRHILPTLVSAANEQHPMFTHYLALRQRAPSAHYFLISDESSSFFLSWNLLVLSRASGVHRIDSSTLRQLHDIHSREGEVLIAPSVKYFPVVANPSVILASSHHGEQRLVALHAEHLVDVDSDALELIVQTENKPEPVMGAMIRRAISPQLREAFILTLIFGIGNIALVNSGKLTSSRWIATIALGLFAVSLSTLTLAMLRLSTSPGVVLAVAAGSAIAYRLFRLRNSLVVSARDERITVNVRRTLSTLLVSAVYSILLTVSVYGLAPMALTPDSIDYLVQAHLIAADSIDSVRGSRTYSYRMIALGATHAVAALASLDMILSLSPLFAYGILLRVYESIFLYVKKIAGLPIKYSVALAVAAVAFVASTERFLAHSAYVNTHIIVAYSLIMVATRHMNGLPDDGRRHLPAGALLGLIILLRPEGLVLAVVALVFLPTSVPAARYAAPERAAARDWNENVATWYWVGAVGFLRGLELYLASPSFAFQLQIALGASVILAGLIRHTRISPRLRAIEASPRIRAVVVVGAWLVFLLSNNTVLEQTRITSVQNLILGHGGWGTAGFIAAGMLLLLGVSLTRLGGDHSLSHLALSYFPAMAFVNILRGSGGRIGPGDSLTRMAMHVFPVLVVSFVVWCCGDRRNQSNEENESQAPDRQSRFRPIQ